jgi:hypothetical protein
MEFTKSQLDNYVTYERIRAIGAFNMFDPRARNMSGMSSKEWVFCIEHYNDLKKAVGETDGS